MIKYIGKCLLIEEDKEKVLVVGDIHIGSGGIIGGIDIESKIFEEIVNELEEVFKIIGIKKADKIILLGDLKHEFSRLSNEERYGIVNIIDYLEKKCNEVIVIKGNHDNYLLNLLGKRGIKILDYYIWKEYAFLHGDRDFSEIWGEELKFWVMGHLHPTISLNEGVKVERYKCFLEGEFKGKKVIIIPSFSENREGIDAREGKSNLAWDFALGKFKAIIVGEKGEVLDFGRLDKIR